jgi:hypothetical protein
VVLEMMVVVVEKGQRDKGQRVQLQMPSGLSFWLEVLLCCAVPRPLACKNK